MYANIIQSVSEGDFSAFIISMMLLFVSICDCAGVCQYTNALILNCLWTALFYLLIPFTVASRWKCHFKVTGGQTGRTERWYIKLKPSTKLKSPNIGEMLTHSRKRDTFCLSETLTSCTVCQVEKGNGWVFLLSGLLLWLYINKLWQLYCMCEGFIFLLSPPAGFPIFILQ